jgi:hypothetical protein
MRDTIRLPFFGGRTTDVSRIEAIDVARAVVEQMRSVARFGSDRNGLEFTLLMTQAQAIEALIYFALGVRHEAEWRGSSLNVMLSLSEEIVAASHGSAVVDAALGELRERVLRAVASRREEGA